MIIKRKYKIARRLGAPVFEKTQTPKFAQSLARRSKSKQSSKPKARTDYGMSLNEKQKARYSYGVNERQFRKYVNTAIATKGNTAELLTQILESRLDNAVLRLGFGTTRSFARQLVAHGHITVNGKAVTIPSFEVSVGDKISIRLGSQKKPVFATLDERIKTVKLPAWISYNTDKREGTVEGIPKISTTELLFNPGAVIEFYSR